MHLSNYTLGAQWAEAHPRAVAYILDRCRVDNLKGRKGRLQAYIEEMRLDPARFDLTAEKNGTFGFNHTARSEVARYLMDAHGVEFAIRKAACDHQGTQATPEIRSA